MTTVSDTFLDTLEERYGPVARNLSMTLRPTFCAKSHDKIMMWGDWAAIEARILPWLTNSRGGNKILKVFRDCDKNPSAPDVYMMIAAPIFNTTAEQINEGVHNKNSEAKNQRQVGKVACIAEGQKVLTENGLVPIEQVRRCARVWDGVDWVTHSGVISKGVKDVYTYQGLTATADHIVWTDEGAQTRFDDCIINGKRLARTGNGSSIRLATFDKKRDNSGQTPARACKMRRLRARKNRRCRQSVEWEKQRVPAMFATASSAYMVIEKVSRSESAVREPKQRGMGELREERRGVPFPVSVGCRFVGNAQLGFAQNLRVRPYRQQRSLRTRQSKMGYAQNPNTEYPTLQTPRGLDLQSGRMALRKKHRRAQIAGRFNARRDFRRGRKSCHREAQMLAHYTGKVRTYDIVNAGPRARFTVSDCLVHNCLSLGFGGGVGALTAMATGYGLHFEEHEAQRIVNIWRDENPWAKAFWSMLNRAFENARLNPGQPYVVGRLTYIYDPGYHNGTMFCVLPCGRVLSYPSIKVRKIKKVDKKTGEEYKKDALTYRKQYAYSALWHGILAENPTQAVAASLLRGTLKRLEDARTDDLKRGYEPLFETVGHTHDEVIGEVYEDEVETGKAFLKTVMEKPFDWSDGLPLVAEITHNWYYTKAKD